MVLQSSHPLAQYENLLDTELHCLHHDLLKIENDDFFVLSPKKKAFFQIAIPCMQCTNVYSDYNKVKATNNTDLYCPW